jgi:hypothetical protein
LTFSMVSLRHIFLWEKGERRSKETILLFGQSFP